MKSLRKVFGFVLLLVGLSCVLFPVLSNYINSLEHSYTFNVYETVIQEKDDLSEELKACYDYNQRLVNKYDRYEQSDEALSEYNSLLNISQGLIGYLEIPKINVNQPIYHSSDAASLSQGVGHVFGTSLPVGGTSTHAVLAGHTGMSSQIMFNDLNKMEIGDRFYIRVLDRTLTYEVDQIKMVVPSDMSEIEIEEYCDYVTLVTCYPIGVGSHRLLVRGHNIEISSEQAEEEIITTQKTITTTDKINWALLAFAVLIII